MSHTVLRHERLTRSLESAPIIAKGEYDYLVHPLTDGVPRVDPELLREATDLMAEQIRAGVEATGETLDLLVTAEAMGLPLVTQLAERLGVPFVIARKRSYGLPGEIPLDQHTGYSHGTLYLNGVHPGDRVVIVDDLISTGGTLRALTHGIDEAGARLLHIAALVTKQDNLSELAEELDCSVSALAAITIKDALEGKRVRVLGVDLHA